jgi:hypothetical protein
MAKILTTQEFEIATERALAHYQGYQDGENYQMSNPNEPRFEDDFDCDEEPQEIEIMGEGEITLYSIAITKAHAYAQEYNKTTGRVEDKPNYHALKEGYTAGFLEGFAHRLTHNTGE